MPPIVKESETLAATTTAAPSAARPSVANSAEAAARPQPVALEVPVSVNGARTVEGTDKREPFSESTKTVLVFGHGAVIRLTSNVAPGQLLFLTNDRTKKEVVCQVVKSKNYRNVSGYVELEFTEPVVGFWGMRFPTDRIGSQGAPVAAGPVLVPAVALKVTAPAPVAAKPVPTAPVLSQPVTPKAAAEKIAPPPAVIASPAPPAVEIAKGVAPAAAITAPPTLEQFLVSANSLPAVAAPSSAPPAKISIEEVAAKIDSLAGAAFPKLDFSTVAPAASAEPSLSALQLPRSSGDDSIVDVKLVPALELPVASPAPVTPSFSELSAALTASLTSAVPSALPSIPPPPPVAQRQATPVSSNSSMEELKQETARLQQQLSALLFPEDSNAPAVPALDSATVLATTEKLLEIAQAEPAPLIESKSALPLRSLLQPALGVEEVKIPSWLEPLTRNDPAPFAAENASVDFATQPSENAADLAENTVSDAAAVESSGESTLDAPSFGSRYSRDEDKSSAPSGGSSKIAMWIGIAAGILLLIGGAAWYFHADSSSSPTTVSAATQPAAAPARSALAPSIPSASAAAPSAAPLSANLAPLVSTPAPAANVPPVVSSRDSANPAANSRMPADTLAALAKAPQPQPVPEQPKRPVMGDVRLAAPVMNRKRSKQDTSESAPELELQGVSAGEGLGSMAISNGNQPAAPLPIGGDVKPAVLLSSVPPVYPALAKTQHVNGDVKIDAFIDATGHVTATKVLSGPTLLHQSAMAAVKQWRYQPATLNGNAVPMHLTVTLQFRLQ